MNDRLKELMLDSGYAAPEIATRAQKLSELIIKECYDMVNSHIQHNNPSLLVLQIKEHFGLKNE